MGLLPPSPRWGGTRCGSEVLRRLRGRKLSKNVGMEPHAQGNKEHERFPLWTNFQNARVFHFGKRATSWRRPQNISYEETYAAT